MRTRSSSARTTNVIMRGQLMKLLTFLEGAMSTFLMSSQVGVVIKIELAEPLDVILE
tara:strand:- start:253 stop:423 length:171 start_codon:yes stop_codon:yes gene_type:complete